VKSVGFSVTDVQSDVLFDTFKQPLSPLTNSLEVLLYACPYVIDALHQVLVSWMCLVHYTHYTHCCISRQIL